MSKSNLIVSHIIRLYGLLLGLSTICFASYASTNDTIPPNIITVSQDIMIDCDLAIEDSLQNWFDRFAGLEAEDNLSDVTYNSLITASEALSKTSCGRIHGPALKLCFFIISIIL